MEAFHIDNMTGRNNSGARPNDPLKRLAVSSLIGDNIFNPAGDNLGKIKDIMVDISEGKIEYVVIEYGGFLGMNQKYFAVPIQALTIAKEHQNAFILNETKESLKRYPTFDKDHWPNTSSDAIDATPSNDDGFMRGSSGK